MKLHTKTIIILVGFILPSISFAKVNYVNVTVDTNRGDFYIEKLKKIQKTNSFNQKMFNAFEAPDMYALFIQDSLGDIFSSTLRSNQFEKMQALNSNGFIPPQMSLGIFDKGRIPTNHPDKKLVEELFDKVRGKPVVFFIQYTKIENGKIFMRETEDAVLFQEFFHAYQYIYYSSKGLAAQYDLVKHPSFYKKIEVEGEIATQIYGPRPLPDIFDRGISSIPNFIELKDALTGTCEITKQDYLNINNVLENIWEILEEDGYQLRNDIEAQLKKLDILTFEALFSLSQSIKFVQAK